MCCFHPTTGTTLPRVIQESALRKINCLASRDRRTPAYVDLSATFH
jgi:hypothetical protein